MTNNLFGTDGIRGSIGTPPFTLTDLSNLGIALGHWIINTYGPSAEVLLAHDTRISYAFVKSALTSGLLTHPLTLYDAHILPTPAVCKLINTSTTPFKCGIIISASHNPYQDNGIKIIDKSKGKLHIEDEIIISELFHFSQNNATYQNLGAAYSLPNIIHYYIELLLQKFSPNFLQGITVVLDCANGATSLSAPLIFQKLGATTIILHNQPNGKNINDHCGTLFPQDVQKTVLQYKAHIGFAFDGDGDRVIAVNHNGIIKNGDDILLLLSQHPCYAHETYIVGTTMSNQGLIAALQQHKKNVLRVNVGDKHILEHLNQKNLLLGGEQSGHIIMRDYLNAGDGIFTALRLIEAILHTNNWEMKTFNQFPQILINVPILHKKNLCSPSLTNIIHTYEKKLPKGRLEVRYSGTEEKILRIMVEDQNADHAQTIGQQLSKELYAQLAFKEDING